MHQPAPLISAAEARRLSAEPSHAIRFIDCQFALQEPEAGHAAYLAGHLPGALYAHLDRDLSNPLKSVRHGRHPLPEADRFERTVRRWGIGRDTHVVAYDGAGGTFASRLWWLLQWAGHTRQSVLNGGLQVWTALGLPLTSGAEPMPEPGDFALSANPSLLVDANAVLSSLTDDSFTLVDSRDPDRYAGLHEPLDPVAGHIPGALNHPYQRNLGPDGHFLPDAELRALLRREVLTADVEETVLYCGSGVSACHTVLAAAQAGLGMPRLYPGSWSEWCADATRPVRQGSEP